MLWIRLKPGAMYERCTNDVAESVSSVIQVGAHIRLDYTGGHMRASAMHSCHHINVNGLAKRGYNRRMHAQHSSVGLLFNEFLHTHQAHAQCILMMWHSAYTVYPLNSVMYLLSSRYFIFIA
jgi:hypothetical protein